MTEFTCPVCGGTGRIGVTPAKEIVVALRGGGMFSRTEWAFLVDPASGEARSFKREGRFLKREGGLNYYSLPATEGNLVVSGYLSGSGKTYRLKVGRVSFSTGEPELVPVIEFDNPGDAEKYLRALGVSAEIW